MTTLSPPKNPNYAAVVVELKAVNDLDGCDNIKGAPVLGFQAIVDKSHQPGDIGVVFTAETQLSSEFARINDLHRTESLNADTTAKGYLEDNRRVRALKLRGHRSDALFLPLSALDYTGLTDQLKPGDVFDELGGHEICRKYEKKIPAAKSSNVMMKATKKFSRVDAKFLPEHYDTARYHGNEDKIRAADCIWITQKLHGTSLRVGNTIVRRQSTRRDKFAQRWMRVPVRDYDYDNVYGSRKVIKDANNPNHNHYYDTDIWTEYGRKLDGLIPQGYAVYGELIGWTPDGKPIQKNYTYNLPQGEAQLYIYRVAFVNPQGFVADLSWRQVQEFCEQRGLLTVPTLGYMLHAEFDPADWIDKRFFKQHSHAVPLSGSAKLVDEGVCIRTDHLIPRILKVKSPIFLQHESRMLDDESAADLEAEAAA